MFFYFRFVSFLFCSFPFVVPFRFFYYCIDEKFYSFKSLISNFCAVFYSVVSDTAKYAQNAIYTDLDSLPDLSVFANIDTLTNYPLISNLDSVAFTGDYNDLENLPDLDNLALDSLSHYSMTSDLITTYATLDTLSHYSMTSGLITTFATLDTLSHYIITNDLITIYATLDTLDYYQSQDFDLTTISNLRRDNLNNRIIISSDSNWVSMGGDTARSALGLAIGSDIQPYDDDLDDLSDGTLSADKVQNGDYYINSDGENGQVWTSD